MQDDEMKNSSSSKGDSPANPTTVSAWMNLVRLGKPQIHRDIVVWPLFLTGDLGPSYRTLEEAVSARLARVSEISDHGSVPELRVVNQSEDTLLILDGEELIGAKQNRVVNTTLLLPAFSEIVIPVSCTEQGRWHNVSTEFSASDTVMEMKVRKAKLQSVSDSLEQGDGHRSDQGRVWEEIQALQEKSGSASPTRAMHDAFKTRKDEILAALKAFPHEPSQQGMLATIRGRVAGFDLISRADAYAQIHGKLVRSYVLDALLTKPGAPECDEKNARTFLNHIGKCHEERFASVGLGQSVRLRNSQIAGAALIHEDAVIHIAAFSLDPVSDPNAEGSSIEHLSKRRRRFDRGSAE
jgi:hypothetical protein